jgi:hypothetical protein
VLFGFVSSLALDLEVLLLLAESALQIWFLSAILFVLFDFVSLLALDLEVLFFYAR